MECFFVSFPLRTQWTQDTWPCRKCPVMPVRAASMAALLRRRAGWYLVVASRDMLRRKRRTRPYFRSGRRGGKNRDQNHREHFRNSEHFGLRPCDFDAEFFREPLADLLRQLVMDATRTLFGGIEHGYGGGCSDRDAQPDQRR